MLSRTEEKLSLTILLVLSTFATSLPVHGLLLPGLLIARIGIRSLRPLTPLAEKRFWKFFWYFLLLSSAMILVNGLLVKDGPVVFRLASLEFFSGGMTFGLQTGARILLLVVSLLTFFTSTSLKEIATFLDRRGLPDQIVMTFMLALHFVDQLPLRFERIFTAQEARGAPVRSSLIGRIRALFAILTPLVLSSIVESVERGMALELRGFHGTMRRSRSESGSTTRITATTVVFLLLSLLSLAWIILQRLIP